jgi:hypothetical protein
MSMKFFNLVYRTSAEILIRAMAAQYPVGPKLLHVQYRSIPPTNDPKAHCKINLFLVDKAFNFEK